ncbi:MAG: glycosyltransferase, partial [Ruminococcus sp.]|nr:glycosyltransferase [Ruminococcus sp.]
MRVLYLCGVYDDVNEKEVIAHSKYPVEFSANVFQKKMIQGFRSCVKDFEVLSAPFVGSYPNASDIVSFKGFEEEQKEYNYVNFCNVWGVRNPSRSKALKRGLDDFIKADDERKLIVAYTPHTPFLEAAVYAKSRDPRIKICLVVPDLPQYMNLNAHISMIYKIGKKFDIRKFSKLNMNVDSYMLLTRHMADKINVHNMPYIVKEGIISDRDISRAKSRIDKKAGNPGAKPDERYIVYTGKMNERFGVKMLVEAFLKLPEKDLRLVLCGKGDSVDFIKRKAHEDSRIMFMGQVTPEEAGKWEFAASVLVNPRTNDEEFAKYSFPSKNIQYLLTGNPVVSFMLGGMPERY